MPGWIALLVVAVLTLIGSAPALAQKPQHRRHARMQPHRRKTVRMVAYDAKDRRYYSVAYARAHHMHDRGGDRLVIVPMASLPRDARMSRAMKGRM